MRIDVTVRRGDHSADLTIAAPLPVGLDTLRAQLLRRAGVPEQASLWHGTALLAPDTVVGVALRSGAVLDIGAPSPRRSNTGVLALHQVGGPDAGRVVSLERGRLTIGRGAECEFAVEDADCSRRHADIEITGTAVSIRDLGSTNGTRIDGDLVQSGSRPLRPGELIRIGDSTFTVNAPSGSPATLGDTGDGTLRVLRPPRRIDGVAEHEVVVPVRFAPARPRGVQWVSALLPAAAGGAIAWATGSAQFLLFAVLSPVMMVSTALGDRMHWRRSRRRDAATYEGRRAASEHQIAAALREETRARRGEAPDPAAVARLAALPGTRLWERRRSDPDFLRVRLGTADLPSTVRRRDGAVTAAAGTVHDVPACVSLRAGPLGVAAPPRVLAGSGRWLVGQLAALHSPADVEIVVLTCDAERWRWCRWLPHVRGRVACGQNEWSRLVGELAADLERRLTGLRHDRSEWAGPWRVLVVDRATRLAEVPGLAALLADGRAGGVTALCFDEDPAALPNGCRTVVRPAGVTGSRAVLASADEDRRIGLVLDDVGAGWSDDLARALAPLIDAGSDDAALPTYCGLRETLHLQNAGAGDISARWAASDGGAATTIGAGADGAVLVDLVADGPHALVAGTTGSGKSELLQALIIGLAADHPPENLSFLLIDYKGGAAFADCGRLPHTAGLVTDLDPYLTTRALRSLDSELRRRERLFARVGARDLAAYRTAATGEPIPRLVIVVDEFAALTDELPDFVRGLVGVAQRGRSLGVHLVLATQRPGTAVTPEIRANTSLRIALRVTDPGESRDVIDAPDAAFVDRSCPGRAYMRCGTELVEVQTAHAGNTSDATDAVTVDLLDGWRRPLTPGGTGSGPSDLTRLVATICKATDGRARPAGASLWLPPLADRIGRSELRSVSSAEDAGTLRVSIAMVDLPDEQRRTPLEVDLGGGSSLLVAGAARSGRTEALATLAIGAAELLDPSRLHLYVVDAGGRLSGALALLAQCGTALGPADLAMTPTLLRRLDRLVSTGFADRSETGVRPRTVLLVDGWDAVMAALPDAETLECADLLASLLRNGSRAGLTVAVTGGRACLAPRLAAQFETKIVLRMTDALDYGMAGVSPRDVPAQLPPGRGLRTTDAALLHVLSATETAEAGALAAAAAALSAALAAIPRPGRGSSGPSPAIRLRSLPKQVALRTLPAPPGRFVLGVGGDDARPLAVDLFAGDGRFLVAGPPRSGRSTLLRSMLLQARRAGLPVAVAAAAQSPLTAVARGEGMPVVTPTTSAAQAASWMNGAEVFLVDDCEAFTDTASGDALLDAIRVCTQSAAVVAAGRNDDLATSYRGIGAHVRRGNCGVLLRPGPVDGELLGVRLPRRQSGGPAGRGMLVGEPSWGPDFADGEPLHIQVALPEATVPEALQPMWG